MFGRHHKTTVFIALFGVLSLCASCKKKTGEARVFRLAYVMSPGGLVHQGALRFADLVAQKTDGAVTVKLYPGGQLGNERVLAEGLSLGISDGILTGAALIGWYAPEFGFVEAPFVFRDYDHLETAMSGTLGTKIKDKLRAHRHILPLANWYRGPRYLTTTDRPVKSPEDLAGLKLRVPELPVYIKSWKLFGANATPIPYPDMFMALKLGVVEGQENPLEVIYTSHLYE
ncbi:MAG: TRAP transporter substrate-binding protein, partial [Bacteroidetes bacterium]